MATIESEVALEPESLIIASSSSWSSSSSFSFGVAASDRGGGA